MMTTIQVAGLLASVTVLVGCTDTDREPIVFESGNEVVFATEVEPYLSLQCGSLDCHGDGERALRLYGKFGLRLRDDLRAQPTSPSEVFASVRALSALAGASVEDNLALLKPLSTEVGGLGHVGGDIWPTTDDPGYQCLLAFLSGRTNPSACAEALAVVE